MAADAELNGSGSVNTQRDLGNFNSTSPAARIVALIKPQFELEPKDLKKGIVKSDETRLQAVEALRTFVKDNFREVEEAGLIMSPIKGAKGNVEYLWYLKKL